MCYVCWEDDGCPTSENLEVGRAAYAIQHLDDFGALHVVIGDWNVDDNMLNACAKHAEIKPIEIAFLEHFKSLTEIERTAALALADGYWGAMSIHDRPN